MHVDQPPYEFRWRGTTSRQMQRAVWRSIYVWSTEDLRYPLRLAQLLDRTDLRIFGPSLLHNNGRRLKYLKKVRGIILDHACQPTEDEFNAYEAALERIEAATPKAMLGTLGWRELQPRRTKP